MSVLKNLKSRANKHGLLLDDVLKMLRTQKKRCAICGKPLTLGLDEHKDREKAKLDHSHRTNKARGLLCNNCNIGLGLFKDSQALLLSAIWYLDVYDDKTLGVTIIDQQAK